MRIIYMGTPDFAVPSLEILLENGFEVVAVVTAPDKPAGRGLQLQSSPVKRCAEEHSIPVLQPEKLKHPDFLATLAGFQADLQVVVAFRMLPEVVWNMQRLGTINLHASLLPAYRGAAPIQWAIIDGAKVTGVTTFFLQHAIDTGNIILQQEVAISEDDDAGSLHDKLMHTGSQVVLKSVQMIAQGNIVTTPQEEGDYPRAPKIFREDCQINWEQPAGVVRNFIRGLSPYPGAYTDFAGKQLKVFRCIIEPATDEVPPGQMQTDYSSYIKYRATDGWVSVTDIQWHGKKRMETSTFLRGYRP